MAEEHPLFILAGNGPYENRGCEAIVRGTTKILRRYYQNPEFISVSDFQNEDQYKKLEELSAGDRNRGSDGGGCDCASLRL